ncbi:MAG TPA: VOC family protein [Gammaproteobacteria bacterium]|jgi:PhnB protein|nr:VOC family protein [Gammaproteobacteria bacterium]
MAKKLKAKSKKKVVLRKKSAAQKTRKLPAKKVAAKRKKTKVLAVPKGYHSITPYLMISNAAKAIDFYKKVFGAKEVMRVEHTPGKINHAELQIGDSKIMLSDECPEMNARSPQTYGGSPVSIHLYVKNVDAVVNQAVAAGAKLFKPIETMFYGDRSGMLTDPYGHLWCVSTHVENVSAAEMKKRMAKLFKKD